MDFDPVLLKRYRKLAGMTVAELAERSGLSVGQVVRFENGLRPSAESWDKLRAALRGALDRAARDVTAARDRLKRHVA